MYILNICIHVLDFDHTKTIKPGTWDHLVTFLKRRALNSFKPTKKATRAELQIINKQNLPCIVPLPISFLYGYGLISLVFHLNGTQKANPKKCLKKKLKKVSKVCNAGKFSGVQFPILKNPDHITMMPFSNFQSHPIIKNVIQSFDSWHNT